MSEVLYRKYRPTSFKEVVGQDHVVAVLEGALNEDAISHAYLFSGSRGTGKTSVARIFAKELGTTEKDLYEMDAASNRGIDDIRALREAVSVLPFDSKYKVYIIDEAHMLTKEACNALLKTLEEPPAHTLFILATTETEKLPETIVSRCQSFAFKQPTISMIKDVVTEVAKKETYTLEPAAAELIAVLAEGSFRDAHGVLQKILASSKDASISVEEVERVTGAPKNQLVNAVVEGIASRQVEQALEAVRAANAHGADMKTFMKLLLQKARAVLLLRHAPQLHELLQAGYTDDDVAFLKRLAEEKNSCMRASALKHLLEAYDATDRACIPQLPLELALISMIGQDSKE